ncbi:hypothetical protein Tco_0523887 [Tanacetum coccineum]
MDLQLRVSNKHRYGRIWLYHSSNIGSDNLRFREERPVKIRTSQSRQHESHKSPTAVLFEMETKMKMRTIMRLITRGLRLFNCGYQVSLIKFWFSMVKPGRIVLLEALDGVAKENMPIPAKAMILGQKEESQRGTIHENRQSLQDYVSFRSPEEPSSSELANCIECQLVLLLDGTSSVSENLEKACMTVVQADDLPFVSIPSSSASSP